MTEESLRASVEAYLSEQAESYGLQGAVLVRHHGKELLSSSFGLSDVARGEANTPGLAFQLASVSKQFTAAAILLLQERGALSVNGRINDWIADLPPSWQEITVHHLLTHSSGIGHWQDYPEVDLYHSTENQQLIGEFVRGELLFKPGEGWSYSSPAYVLLAHIVEQASGEPYGQFLARNLFDGVGMADTRAGNDPPCEAAVGHSAGSPTESFELDQVAAGAGDVWSTTADMAKWDEALNRPGILNEDSLRALFTPHVHLSLPDRPGLAYGYGWFLQGNGTHPLQFHTGDNAGFRAFFARLPDVDACVIVLVNDDQINQQRVGEGIISLLLEAS